MPVTSSDMIFSTQGQVTPKKELYNMADYFRTHSIFHAYPSFSTFDEIL